MWLSRAEAEQYRGCKVARFEDALRIIAESSVPNLRLMWDLRGPFPKNYVEIFLDIYNETRGSGNVMWLTGYNARNLELVQNITRRFPDLAWAYSADFYWNLTNIQEARDAGFAFINAPAPAPDLGQTDLTKIV